MKHDEPRVGRHWWIKTVSMCVCLCVYVCESVHEYVFVMVFPEGCSDLSLDAPFLFIFPTISAKQRGFYLETALLNVCCLIRIAFRLCETDLNSYHVAAYYGTYKGLHGQCCLVY